MCALLLNSLRIVNFRAFKDLKIERLGRVNLFVGKNNVGKTSVLEALWLYANRGAPAIMRDLLEARDETKLPGMQGSTELQSQTSAIKYLIHGRNDIGRNPQTIVIGPIDGSDGTLAVSFEWVEKYRDDEGRDDFKSIPADRFNVVLNRILGVNVEFYSVKAPVRPLEWYFDQSWGKSPKSGPFEAFGLTNIYVPSGGPSALQISNWRDRSITEGKKGDVLKALRIIAPEIEDVDFIGGRGTAAPSYIPSLSLPVDRVPVVRLKNANNYIPLRSLGDGMNHMFASALALINAENGILMIDEIENGLHYSIQPEMWSFILQAATLLNVQVFATTHSKDCVEAFSKITGDDEEEGVLIRLGRKGDDIVATTFDEEELGIATEQDIDIR